MKVYVVGNSFVNDDSLPIRLISEFQKAFPMISFEEIDPNENFVPVEGSVIIDSVKGIDDVMQYDDIDRFVTTKSVSPHDYDLGFHLKLLRKLNKVSNITILGLPMNGSNKKVIRAVSQYLHRLMEKRKNEGKS